MRRHMHLLAVGQQKPVGRAMLIDEKLVYGAGDFGQMVGIDPMHCEAPCVRLSECPDDLSQGACQGLSNGFIIGYRNLRRSNPSSFTTLAVTKPDDAASWINPGSCVCPARIFQPSRAGVGGGYR